MYFIDYHNKYLSAFVAIAMHEISHILVSVAQGRKLYSLRIFIIGLNAVFCENHQENPNYFLINIAGPLSNILISLVCIILSTYYLPNSDNMRFFILINISLAIFNILPILPLDGGRILRDILASKVGLIKAHKYSKRVSKGLGLLIILIGIIQLHNNIYNFSLLFIGCYIFYCMRYEESEVYFMNIKNLVYKRSRFLKKGVYPGRELVVIKNMRLGDIVKDMDFDRFHIIYVLDDDMRLVKVFTEQEIIDNMSKLNGEISFEDLINNMN
jgi:stage IV sporulation protein FB